MNILKRTHNSFYLFESGYIYCMRRNLDYQTFIHIYIQPDLDINEGSEFMNISNDLRQYRYSQNYSLKEITEEEYESCFIKFKDEC